MPFFTKIRQEGEHSCSQATLQEVRQVPFYNKSYKGFFVNFVVTTIQMKVMTKKTKMAKEMIV